MRLADFELEYEDRRADNEHDVDAFAHARYGVLEVDATGTVDQDALKDCDLFEPGGFLSLVESEWIRLCQFAEYLGITGVEKVVD